MSGLARLEAADLVANDSEALKRDFEEEYGATALDGSHSGTVFLIDEYGQVRFGGPDAAERATKRLIRQAQSFKSYTMWRTFCAVDVKRLIAGTVTPEELRAAMGTDCEGIPNPLPCANGVHDRESCYHLKAGHDPEICFHLRPKLDNV